MPQEYVSAGPQVIQLDLSVGRVNERLDVPAGTYFAIWDVTPRSLDPVLYVGFDRSDRQAQIPFRWKEERIGKFREVYVTNVAQPNTRVTIVVGAQHEFLLRPMAGLSEATSAAIKTVFLTNPAAGANYTSATDAATFAGRRYRIVQVSFSLGTSAAVANRTVYVALTQTGAASWTHYAVASATIPASTTAHVSCGPGLTPESRTAPAGTQTIALQIPNQLILQGAMSMQINVDGIQAADQLFNIQFTYEEI